MVQLFLNGGSIKENSTFKRYKYNNVLPPSFISLPISFAQNFTRNSIMGHTKREKRLFILKVEYMCDEKFVILGPFQNSKKRNG